MNDPIQTVLLFVIVVLTFLLLILGMQIYYILKEVRQTITKANKVLDDTGVITESISEPVAMVSSLITGIKTGASVMRFFKDTKKENDTETEDGE